MNTQNAVWKKVLKMSLAGTFAISPITMGASVAQAAPPRQAPAYGYRDKDGNRDRKNYQTLTGRVSNVKGQQFDLRVGNTTYNILASSRLPNGLNQGDNVRVYGERYGNNNMRNANVSVIGNNDRGKWDNNRDRWDNNRRNDRNDRWDNYQTFTGRVTDVESRSKFNVRIGNDTFNVYPSGHVPNKISENDTVRIYGQRYGDNDIRNANVVIVSNNNNGDWNNNNWNNNRNETFTGTVTDVESNSEFEIQSGNQKYDVYLSTNAPRRLDKGDTVRVYGSRYGDNDIRNANVTIIRNTNNDNWDDDKEFGNYQTFSGVVTNVESNSEFDIRIGNDTYNVYPSGRIPNGISKNDTVRIYGRRYGDNDIRNANVVILRNR